MTWEPELEELERRKQRSFELGGEERVQRRHDNGRFTVRERLDMILDPGSFRERGVLAGKAEYEDGELTDFRPSNYVMGLGEIGGRRVVIGGDDFTVRGGVADGAVGGKKGHAERMARELQLPIVKLVDGTGGGGSVKTIQEIGRTYVPGLAGLEVLADLLGQVPVVAAAMGSVAGIGYEPEKNELGGAQIHARKSGAIDNEAEDEADAFRQIQQFLSYMPSNVWQLPPVEDTDDPSDRRDDALLSIIPRDRLRPYDVRQLINCVIDRDSFFEMGRYFGPSVVTGLGRIAGRPVAMLANDPMKIGGSLDGPASDKMAKFVDLADTFNLPVVNFVDQPGFMLGVAAEEQGTIKRGTRALTAVWQAKVPWASVVVRRVYGVAGGGHQNSSRWNYRVAWPSGDWGSLPIEGGVMAAYRREIEAAPNPDARRQEIEESLNAMRSPFRTADAFNIEDIIDPRDTRPLLADWVAMAYETLPQITGEKKRSMRP